MRKIINSHFASLFFKNQQQFSSKRQIPVIDIKDLYSNDIKKMKKVGKHIDDANKDIGFFLIKNTAVDFNFVKKTIDVCNEFFASDEKNKLTCRRDDSEEYKPWGYFPRNREQLKRGYDVNKTEKQSYLNDINEQFNLQNDNPKAKLAPRLFPPHPKEFKTVMTEYWKKCQQLSDTLARGFALGLDLPANFFDDKFTHCASCLRTLHYPENVKVQPGQFRASEHTDYGFLTILYSNGPGLQVKARNGDWIDIEVPWEHFVINIGDLMAFWTNDRWVSNLHRVIAKENEVPQKRISLAYFHNPNYDALVETLPSCITKETPLKYEKIFSGDFIMKKFRTSIGEK